MDFSPTSYPYRRQSFEEAEKALRILGQLRKLLQFFRIPFQQHLGDFKVERKGGTGNDVKILKRQHPCEQKQLWIKGLAQPDVGQDSRCKIWIETVLKFKSTFTLVNRFHGEE